MKKSLVLSICLSSFAFFIVSCGGGKQDSTSTDTKQQTNTPSAPSAPARNIQSADVKGTMAVDSTAKVITEVIMGSGADNPTVEGLIVQIKHIEIHIRPIKGTYDSLENVIESNIKNFGDSFDAIEKGNNSIFYHFSDQMSGAKDAYSFFALIKGKTKSYSVIGKSDDMMKPITDKDAAAAAYKIALTFQPTE